MPHSITLPESRQKNLEGIPMRRESNLLGRINTELPPQRLAQLAGAACRDSVFFQLCSVYLSGIVSLFSQIVTFEGVGSGVHLSSSIVSADLTDIIVTDG